MPSATEGSVHRAAKRHGALYVPVVKCMSGGPRAARGAWHDVSSYWLCATHVFPHVGEALHTGTVAAVFGVQTVFCLGIVSWFQQWLGDCALETFFVWVGPTLSFCNTGKHTAFAVRDANELPYMRLSGAIAWPGALCASENFQPASNLLVQSLRRSTSGTLLPCRCKLFAICWVLGISCTLRDFTNLPCHCPITHTHTRMARFPTPRARKGTKGTPERHIPARPCQNLRNLDTTFPKHTHTHSFSLQCDCFLTGLVQS